MKEEIIELEVGSHNRIIIKKVYGPTCVKDLIIVWENGDWNVRNKIKELKKTK